MTIVLDAGALIALDRGDGTLGQGSGPHSKTAIGSEFLPGLWAKLGGFLAGKYSCHAP